MRSLLLLLALPLSAQVWEPAAMVRWEPRHPYPVEPARPFAVERVEPTGRVTHTLPFPRQLQQDHEARLTWWRGEAFAFGSPNHPALASPALQPRRGQPIPRIIRLMRSRDFGPWEPFATYGQDPHGTAFQFLPLENGTFLADASTGAFFAGGQRSPLAIYIRDPKGRMALERLLPLPSGPGWDMPWWRLCRTSKGLVRISHGGHVLVLDNRNGALRHQLALDPDLPPSSTFRKPMVLDAQALPDGTLLMALVDRATAGSQLGPDRQADLTPRPHWAEDLLSRRGIRYASDLPTKSTLRWKRLDPASGGVVDVPPPQGFPTHALPYWTREVFSFRVLPDGNLRWHLPVPSFG